MPAACVLTRRALSLVVVARCQLTLLQVAVGASHAALTTRGGEVYTWGAGLGGNMGNGTGCGSNHPQQVIVVVYCSQFAHFC